jgi:hypothetical protein
VQEGHLVKITVRVAVDTGDDTTEPVETQVLALSRDELTPDTLGLHLAEAHELLAALQEALVNAQVTRALDQHRHCPECDTAFRRKDIKTIRLTTLFGVVAVDSPRYRSCPCRVREVATVSPLTTVLTEHTTPETVYMQARFAAVMSYRPAAALLGEVFPLGRTLHAAGVREQTHRVAARLDNERGPENTAGFSCCPRDLEDLPVPALPLVVGLDGGYVHSAAQTSRSNGWFEVIAGKSIPPTARATRNASRSYRPSRQNRGDAYTRSSRPKACRPTRRWSSSPTAARTCATCPDTSTHCPSTTWTGSTSPCG